MNILLNAKFIGKRVLPSLLSFVLCSNTVYSQASPLDTLSIKLNQFNRDNFQEKLFVHTDKDFYLAGETLWFKVYCLDGTIHKPSFLSKVAYVEVLDQVNKPVLQAKIELTEGEGDGSLSLPLTLSSGHFKLRCYTKWMENFNTDYFFEKPITIVNSFKNIEVQPAQQPSSYTIDFFPEGGDLINDIPTKVAFKIKDQYQRGVDGKGVIVDETNDTLTRFEALKFGIGHFLFTPIKKHKYKAIVQLPDGTTVKQDLPIGSDQGYSMHVRNIDNNKAQVAVQYSSNANEPTDEALFLIVHTRQEIKVAEKGIFKNNKATFDFDLDKLGEGISHLTIFNSKQQPVCERLYFKRPTQNLFINARPDSLQYNTRKPVSISIESKSQTGTPVPTSMSVAIYRLDSLQSLDSLDIQTYLWLTSDLTGTVESPSYYIKHTDSVADQAVDNLMLTHGWRRLEWKEVLANKRKALLYEPEFYGHTITGKVVDMATGKPAKAVQVLLSVPGKQSQLSNKISNDNGILQFNLKDFYGSKKLVVQTANSFRTEILNPFSEVYSSRSLTPFYFLKHKQDQLLKHSIGMQVRNVFAATSIVTESIQSANIQHFYGQPDHTYLLDDYTRFPTTEEVLREYVREINVKKKEGSLQMAVLNNRKKEYFIESPLVLLDGMPVLDQSQIFAYDPTKIEKLEIISARYFLGHSIFNGIANFITYKGDLNGFNFDANAISLDYEGLQQQRQFYSPKYQTAQEISSRIPDFRNVLLWSPKNKTGKQGKGEISFYTSDQKGNYVGVIQGISNEGSASNTYFTFSVR